MNPNQLVTILPKKFSFSHHIHVAELHNITSLILKTPCPWYIAEVEVDGGELEETKCEETEHVYMLDKYFMKIHGVSFSNITLLKDHPIWEDEKACLELLEKDLELFEYFKVQTPEICSKAMKLPSNLQYLKEQTEELCIKAMENDTEVDEPQWHSLQYVREQTLPIVQAAIKANVIAYVHVKEPFRSNRDIILEVLKNCGRMIEYVFEQTEEYCEVALESCPDCLSDCKAVSRELLERTVVKHPKILSHVRDQDEKLCHLAFSSDPKVVRLIRKDEDFDRYLEKLTTEGKLTSDEAENLKKNRYPVLKSLEKLKNKVENKEEFVRTVREAINDIDSTRKRESKTSVMRSLMKYCIDNIEILDNPKFWKTVHAKLEEFKNDLDLEFYENGRKLLKERVEALGETLN